MANNSSMFPRTPQINRDQLKKIMSIGDCSVIRISVTKDGNSNDSKIGSAFFGETENHQKVLFTARHLFSSVEDTKLTLKCANDAGNLIFTIPLETYDRERLFLLNDPDSAAIILNDYLIRQCELANSAFVTINKFEPILKPITIQGFPKGGQIGRAHV